MNYLKISFPNQWLRFAITSLLALAIFPILCGCMSPARALDQNAVNHLLQEGQTQAQVRELFGQPTYSETGANGKKLDVFIVQFPGMTAVGKMASLEVRSLFIRYNAAGKVEKFAHYIGHAKGFAVAHGEMWRAGRPFSSETLHKIQVGETSADELIQMFGPPTIQGFDVYGLGILQWFYVEGRNASVLSGQELFVRVDGEVAADFAVRSLKP